MVQAGGVAGDQLRSFIERIERLEEEKRGIAEDMKEVYKQAKAVGFDTKIMRKVVALRKKDQAERQEEEALLDVYLHALEGGDRPAASGGEGEG
ncbi:DUF2312 domain-containing protein [Yunchengibacter salinarum]|uniref:DUF2312 domain-containing protein n=1 Tax=Yunchengibacter salinarum TaxID=3133399 RepID=UPI0035B65447